MEDAGRVKVGAQKAQTVEGHQGVKVVLRRVPPSADRRHGHSARRTIFQSSLTPCYEHIVTPRTRRPCMESFFQHALQVMARVIKGHTDAQRPVVLIHRTKRVAHRGGNDR